MQLPRCLLTSLFALALPAAWAIDRLPIEDFAREPSAAKARLSPDGKRLAFLRDYGSRTMLHIAEIDDNKLSRLDMGEATMKNEARKEVSAFTWVGDRRLVVTTTVWDQFYGVVAVNADGGQPVPISGYENNLGQVKSVIAGRITYTMSSALRETVHAFYDKDASILMGVTRASVLEIAKDLGIDATVAPISVEDVLGADELFFTGTAVEVTAIREVDGRVMSGGKPGPITRRIQETFNQAVRGQRPEYRKWLSFIRQEVRA